jgi:hypothetical protein
MKSVGNGVAEDCFDGFGNGYGVGVGMMVVDGFPEEDISLMVFAIVKHHQRNNHSYL